MGELEEAAGAGESLCSVELEPAAAGSGVSVLSPPVRPAMMMRLRMSAPAMAHQRLYQAF
jgi:hypothetical protein